MEITSNSIKSTTEIASDVANKLNGGDIVLLYGELGAGKTTFVKGLAKALGVEENITSPTFAIMQLYELTGQNKGVERLVHIDTYRLKEEKELIDVGIEDYIGKLNTITLIEWPEKVPSSLLTNRNVIRIHIEYSDKESRKFKIEGIS